MRDDDLPCTDRITIPGGELRERFTRAGGPGGQNVNKVETAVELRWDAARSTALSEAVRRRLLQRGGHLATAAGEIVIRSETHRSREANRQEARQRLARLVAESEPAPRRRRPTRPGRGARERRLEAKKQRGRTKAARRRPPSD